MNAMDVVNQYLHGLERRLKMFAISRGSAITAIVALGVTILMVMLTNRFAFSSASLMWARGVLFVSLGIAIALGIVQPVPPGEPAACRAAHRAGILRNSSSAC